MELGEFLEVRANKDRRGTRYLAIAGEKFPSCSCRSRHGQILIGTFDSSLSKPVMKASAEVPVSSRASPGEGTASDACW